MGRTLDYEFSYGEQITITPRNYEFDFRFAGKIKSYYALIGMAFVAEGYPLYYDAVNEKGLGMAGLNFVGNAAYEEALPEDEMCIRDRPSVCPVISVRMDWESDAPVSQCKKLLRRR